MARKASWDPTLAVDTAGTLCVFAVYQQNFKPRLGLVTSHDGGLILRHSCSECSGCTDLVLV